MKCLRFQHHENSSVWRSGARAGVAALELAAVLPILVIVLAATTDYCRFSSTEINVANAARCGAGYGSTHPYDQYTEAAFLRDCRQAVLNELSGMGGFDASLVAITISKQGIAPDDRIEVTASYPFRTAINWAFLPRQTNIVKKSTLPMIR